MPSPSCKDILTEDDTSNLRKGQHQSQVHTPLREATVQPDVDEGSTEFDDDDEEDGGDDDATTTSSALSPPPSSSCSSSDDGDEEHFEEESLEGSECESDNVSSQCESLARKAKRKSMFSDVDSDSQKSDLASNADDDAEEEDSDADCAVEEDDECSASGAPLASPDAVVFAEDPLVTAVAAVDVAVDDDAVVDVDEDPHTRHKRALKQITDYRRVVRELVLCNTPSSSRRGGNNAGVGCRGATVSRRRRRSPQRRLVLVMLDGTVSCIDLNNSNSAEGPSSSSFSSSSSNNKACAVADWTVPSAVLPPNSPTTPSSQEGYRQEAMLRHDAVAARMGGGVMGVGGRPQKHSGRWRAAMNRRRGEDNLAAADDADNADDDFLCNNTINDKHNTNHHEHVAVGHNYGASSRQRVAAKAEAMASLAGSPLLPKALSTFDATHGGSVKSRRCSSSSSTSSSSSSSTSSSSFSSSSDDEDSSSTSSSSSSSSSAGGRRRSGKGAASAGDASRPIPLSLLPTFSTCPLLSRSVFVDVGKLTGATGTGASPSVTSSPSASAMPSADLRQFSILSRMRNNILDLPSASNVPFQFVLRTSASSSSSTSHGGGVSPNTKKASGSSAKSPRTNQHQHQHHHHVKTVHVSLSNASRDTFGLVGLGSGARIASSLGEEQSIAAKEARRSLKSRVKAVLRGLRREWAEADRRVGLLAAAKEKKEKTKGPKFLRSADAADAACGVGTVDDSAAASALPLTPSPPLLTPQQIELLIQRRQLAAKRAVLDVIFRLTVLRSDQTNKGFLKGTQQRWAMGLGAVTIGTASVGGGGRASTAAATQEAMPSTPTATMLRGGQRVGEFPPNSISNSSGQRGDKGSKGSGVAVLIRANNKGGKRLGVVCTPTSAAPSPHITSRGGGGKGVFSSIDAYYAPHRSKTHWQGAGNGHGHASFPSAPLCHRGGDQSGSLQGEDDGDDDYDDDGSSSAFIVPTVYIQGEVHLFPPSSSPAANKNGTMSQACGGEVVIRHLQGEVVGAYLVEAGLLNPTAPMLGGDGGKQRDRISGSRRAGWKGQEGEYMSGPCSPTGPIASGVRELTEDADGNFAFPSASPKHNKGGPDDDDDGTNSDGSSSLGADGEVNEGEDKISFRSLVPHMTCTPIRLAARPPPTSAAAETLSSIVMMATTSAAGNSNNNSFSGQKKHGNGGSPHSAAAVLPNPSLVGPSQPNSTHCDVRRWVYYNSARRFLFIGDPLFGADDDGDGDEEANVRFPPQVHPQGRSAAAVGYHHPFDTSLPFIDDPAVALRNSPQGYYHPNGGGGGGRASAAQSPGSFFHRPQFPPADPPDFHRNDSSFDLVMHPTNTMSSTATATPMVMPTHGDDASYGGAAALHHARSHRLSPPTLSPTGSNGMGCSFGDIFSGGTTGGGAFVVARRKALIDVGDIDVGDLIDGRWTTVACRYSVVAVPTGGHHGDIVERGGGVSRATSGGSSGCGGMVVSGATSPATSPSSLVVRSRHQQQQQHAAGWHDVGVPNAFSLHPAPSSSNGHEGGGGGPSVGGSNGAGGGEYFPFDSRGNFIQQSSPNSPSPQTGGMPSSLRLPGFALSHLLSRHTLLGIVGRGAEGLVIKAQDRFMGFVHAIKIIAFCPSNHQASHPPHRHPSAAPAAGGSHFPRHPMGGGHPHHQSPPSSSPYSLASDPALKEVLNHYPLFHRNLVRVYDFWVEPRTEGLDAMLKGLPDLRGDASRSLGRAGDTGQTAASSLNGDDDEESTTASSSYYGADTTATSATVVSALSRQGTWNDGEGLFMARSNTTTSSLSGAADDDAGRADGKGAYYGPLALIPSSSLRMGGGAASKGNNASTDLTRNPREQRVQSQYQSQQQQSQQLFYLMIKMDWCPRTLDTFLLERAEALSALQEKEARERLECSVATGGSRDQPPPPLLSNLLSPTATTVIGDGDDGEFCCDSDNVAVSPSHSYPSPSNIGTPLRHRQQPSSYGTTTLSPPPTDGAVDGHAASHRSPSLGLCTARPSPALGGREEPELDDLPPATLLHRAGAVDTPTPVLMASRSVYDRVDTPLPPLTAPPAHAPASFVDTPTDATQAQASSEAPRPRLVPIATERSASSITSASAFANTTPSSAATTTTRHLLKLRSLQAQLQTIVIAVHLFEALQYIHEAGLVHLDVKPMNLFIMVDERVVLSHDRQQRLMLWDQVVRTARDRGDHHRQSDAGRGDGEEGNHSGEVRRVVELNESDSGGPFSSPSATVASQRGEEDGAVISASPSPAAALNATTGALIIPPRGRVPRRVFPTEHGAPASISTVVGGGGGALQRQQSRHTPSTPVIPVFADPIAAEGLEAMLHLPSTSTLARMNMRGVGGGGAGGFGSVPNTARSVMSGVDGSNSAVSSPVYSSRAATTTTPITADCGGVGLDGDGGGGVGLVCSPVSSARTSAIRGDRPPLHGNTGSTVRVGGQPQPPSTKEGRKAPPSLFGDCVSPVVVDSCVKCSSFSSASVVGGEVECEAEAASPSHRTADDCGAASATASTPTAATAAAATAADHYAVPPLPLPPIDRRFESSHLLVKLGDFGISATSAALFPPMAEDFFGGSGCGASPSLFAAGTDLYASPEQKRGGLCTAASDVFSAALVLVEMFSCECTAMGRRRLLTRASAEGGLWCAESPPSPSSITVPPAVLERCPEAALPLISACLSHDPTRRPSAGEVVGRLRDLHDRLLNTH